MRVSSAAIFTLVSVAAGNVPKPALAAPSFPTTQVDKTGNVVIPVTQATPAQVKAVASPETVIIQQFSQNSAPVPSGSNKNNDLVVTATNVQVVGATPELQQIIRSVIKTQAGGETSQSQLQKDVAAILDTNLFASAIVNSRNTPTGLSVEYQVKPVVVRSLQLSGAKALTYQVALERFQSQIGSPISPTALKQVVEQLNKWYADNSYSVARVVSITPSREGILTLNVAEGVVSEIKFRFVNDEGKTVDDKGKPVVGRTKTAFLIQQLKLKPGQVLQNNVVREDLQQLYRLGLFEKVNVALEGDANKVDLVYELKEVGARSVNVGGNYTADQGVLGNLTFRDQNIGGVNNILGANIQVGQRDLQFDTSFTNPYRPSNPDRFGYRVNAFRQGGLSDTFDGDIKLANGDKVREGKIGGGISFQRPIVGWDTSLGLNYNRISLLDRAGKITPTDEKGNPLSLSGTGVDDLTTVSFTAIKDRRNNLLNPTQGSVVSLTTEQSIPIGQGNISMNRLRANYSQFLPIKLFSSKQSQVFALNLQAGTIIGDLPPYEAFNLGGANSVRGYNTNDVGSGRSYVSASAEYRFPVFSALGGVLFADFASDLGSGDTVLGNPAGVRGKPGTGFGYGAGVRLNSPLGLLRADYGFTDQGESRLQFGIGHRF